MMIPLYFCTFYIYRQAFVFALITLKESLFLLRDVYHALEEPVFLHS